MRRGRAWLLAAVALAGCGGGDGPSRSDFAARAEGICAEASASTASLQRQIREAARLREPALVFRRTALLQGRLATETGEAADRLDATPHPEDDDELHEWMETLRRARVAREQLAAAYGARDLALIARTAAAADRLDEQADELARRIGMPACASLG
jgi:hypothetical protein